MQSLSKFNYVVTVLHLRESHINFLVPELSFILLQIFFCGAPSA